MKDKKFISALAVLLVLNVIFIFLWISENKKITEITVLIDEYDNTEIASDPSQVTAAEDIKIIDLIEKYTQAKYSKAKGVTYTFSEYEELFRPYVTNFYATDPLRNFFGDIDPDNFKENSKKYYTSLKRINIHITHYDRSRRDTFNNWAMVIYTGKYNITADGKTHEQYLTLRLKLVFDPVQKKWLIDQLAYEGFSEEPVPGL